MAKAPVYFINCLGLSTRERVLSLYIIFLLLLLLFPELPIALVIDFFFYSTHSPLTSSVNPLIGNNA